MKEEGELKEKLTRKVLKEVQNSWGKILYLSNFSNLCMSLKGGEVINFYFRVFGKIWEKW